MSDGPASTTLLKDPHLRTLQEIALRWGVSPPIALRITLNELRRWTPNELSNVLSKVAGMKENLKIIDDALSFDSLLASLRKVALEPTLSSMISRARQGSYVKPPLKLM